MGCGWGSMVLHAARHHGVAAVGITISAEQAALARRRVREAGLEDRVEIRIQDYRNVDDGPYDAISSIGMFEHVGLEQLTTHGHRGHPQCAIAYVAWCSFSTWSSGRAADNPATVSASTMSTMANAETKATTVSSVVQRRRGLKIGAGRRRGQGNRGVVTSDRSQVHGLAVEQAEVPGGKSGDEESEHQVQLAVPEREKHELVTHEHGVVEDDDEQTQRHPDPADDPVPSGSNDDVLVPRGVTR